MIRMYYYILIPLHAAPITAALWGRLKTCAPVGNRRPSDAPNCSISSRAAVWGGPPGPQPAPRPASCLQSQKLRNEPNALPLVRPPLHPVPPCVFKYIAENWVRFAPRIEGTV